MRRSQRLAAVALVGAFTFVGLTALKPAHRPTIAAIVNPGSHLGRFPDFGHLPPAGVYQGRTFELSQDYPTVKPAVEPAVAHILAIDFTKEWRAYSDAVFNYVVAGNIENRDSDDDAFYLEDNKVRRWYHVPWQHWGDAGREGIHGLTSEGPVYPRVLGPAQTNSIIYQSYAVGFYNSLGGYTIGKVWRDANNPDFDAVRREGGFPVGTIVGKVLFTTAPVEQAPFLTNPLQWTAYTKYDQPVDPAAAPVHPGERYLNRKVNLIQMDIMVRDDRAKATGGWVFGTFMYNGNRGAVSKWRNLVPVGLMWGNDPDVTSHSASNPTPSDFTPTNPDLKHTVINAGDKMLPPSHLGWGLRLDGPIDNTMSSCKSCHSTAQFPTISPLLPFMGQVKGCPITPADAEWRRWFRDLGPTDAFDKGGHTMDNSMQLAGSFANFVEARNIETGGRYAKQYFNGQPAARVFEQRGAPPPRDTCKP